MENEQTQNNQSTHSQCDCLKKDIETNNISLGKLKKQRTDAISNSDIKALGTITTTISQLENDNRNFEAQMRKLGCATDQQILPGKNDNQIVIATSVVRRKDARALELIKKELN